MEELVERVKSGDKEAYSELISSVKGILLAIARAKINNEDDVQDVMQETILKAYLNINSLKNNKHFKAWITKILINECKRLYYKDGRKDAIVEKFSRNTNPTSYIDDDSNINFDNLISSLSDKEKNVFELHYKEGLTSKEISHKLGINENTIKTILSRGTIKLKRTIKPASIFMAILILFIATGVIATCIISYVKGLFKVSNGSMDNDNVLMAIEHLEWYQDPEMDYISLNDEYKLKVDYLLSDEMNLYLVVDLYSEKDISKFTTIYIPDLKITNENGDVLCDECNVLSNHYSNKISSKIIKNSQNHLKSLIYMYSDSFPISRTLNIDFSKITLTKDLHAREYIDAKTSFEINVADKFINRHSVQYASDNEKIEKAIVTETGFYSIVQGIKTKPKDVKLVDEIGNYYKCYYLSLTDYDFRYIIIANYNNKESNNLKLVIDNQEYELSQKK